LKKSTLWKVTEDTIALERKTTCTYQKGENLEQKEIQEWIKASILVEGDVSPTQNIHEWNWYPYYGGNLVKTWTKRHISRLSDHQVDVGKHLTATRWLEECKV